MTNYQKKLDELLDNISHEEGIKRLFLHSCCAPCSSYVLENLSKYFEITVFYYNPNIYPLEEYLKRKEEQKRFIKENIYQNKVSFIDCDYDEKTFYDCIKGYEQEPEGGKRCFLCYELRLDETAKKAKELDFDFFGTTLSISPHKNAEKLNEIGEMIEKKYQVKHLPADFKKKNGYKRSIELSKEYGLYRQNYCGCVFSQASSVHENKVY